MRIQTIQSLVEERGGKVFVDQRYPRHGILKIEFHDDDENYRNHEKGIYELFEDRELDFLYQEDAADGGWNRVFKFEMEG